jgi:hypothetical protein
VRDGEAKRHTFEVIGGQSPRAFTREEDEDHPSSKRFGCVQTLDTTAKRWLYAVLQSQGMPRTPQITCLSDGSDTVRDLQRDMRPDAAPIVDWFHLAMQLTVLDHYARGLVHCEPTLGEAIRAKSERLKGALWHGHLSKAFSKSGDIASWLYNGEETYPKFRQWRQAVEECRTSITHNRHLSPHDGERYRHGEAIAPGCVESTVNQGVSKRFCIVEQIAFAQEESVEGVG